MLQVRGAGKADQTFHSRDSLSRSEFVLSLSGIICVLWSRKEK